MFLLPGFIDLQLQICKRWEKASPPDPDLFGDANV